MTKNQKKVLIVLYYWPPAGGPGVQRWLKFVKYLKDFDIQPTVFAPKNPHYPIKDKSLESEIPNHVKVIKSSITEPYALANRFSKQDTNTLSKGIIKSKSKQNWVQKALLYIRGNLFIPDARMLWIKPSVRRIDKLLKSEKFDAIITSGPPHSMHRIGFHLKSKYPDLPWITDFRDPWVNIGYHKDLKLTPHSAEKHRQMEKEVLNTADHIIVTSPSTLEEFESKTKKPVSLITNGYDDTDVVAEPDEHFSLVHVGTLLSERNPESLWQALTELIDDNEHFKSNFELKFVGQVSQHIIESLKIYNLHKHTTFLGYLPHKQAQQQMFDAQVLLLIEKNLQETRGIIPGKLFEYLQAKRPILGAGPKDWDVANLISKHKAGKVFNYNEKDDIKLAVKTYFKAFMQGKLTSQSKNIQAYHRKQLTQHLAEIIG